MTLPGLRANHRPSGAIMCAGVTVPLHLMLARASRYLAQVIGLSSRVGSERVLLSRCTFGGTRMGTDPRLLGEQPRQLRSGQAVLSSLPRFEANAERPVADSPCAIR